MGDTSQPQATIQTNAYGDSYIDLLNEAHFANRSAAEVYRQIFQDSLSQEKTLYVIIGTDSGLFPKHLGQLNSPAGTRYVFVELDLVYPIAMEQCSDEALEKSPVVLPTEWESQLSALNLDHYIYDNKVQIIKCLAANQGHLPDYDELFKTVRIRLETIHHDLISTTAQTQFIYNKLLNTADNIRPAKLLENSASGSAIILAAGPSLIDHLPWVKAHQENITIIAVSRIYQQLKQEGIKPDIVVSVDPFKINYENSKAMLADNDYIFVHTSHVSYQLPAQWDGLAFYMDTLFPWETNKNLENINSDGRTVTHSAVVLAQTMGFEEIYLAGVDLCFDKSGLSHSDGHEAIIDDNLTPTVQTYSEGKAYTDNNLLLGINELAEIVKRGNVKIYNLNINAARIPGIEFKHQPAISSAKAQISRPVSLTKDERINHLTMARKELLRVRIIYNEILKLCKEAIHHNNKLHGNSGIKQNSSSQIKLNKIEQKLNTKYKDFIPTAQQLASRDFLRLLNQSQKHRTPDQEHQWLDNYYTTYQKGTKKVINAIEKALTSIDTRMLEYKPNINLDELFKRWEKENLAGRSCILPEGDQHALNNEGLLEKLTEQCNAFTTQISINQIALLMMRNSLNQARNNEWEKALRGVQESYRLEANLKNGFAKLAWIKYQLKDWQAAWDLGKHDLDTGRITPFWQLNMSLILAQLGTFKDAQTLVEQAYQANPELTDGYIKLAWVIVEGENPDWEKAWKIAQLDLISNRASPLWQIHAAQLCARNGDLAQAVQYVETAYKHEREPFTLYNGYARLSGLLAAEKRWQQAWEIGQRDLQKNKITPTWKIKLALILGQLNHFDKAMRLIEEAYREDSELYDAYSQLAWIIVENQQNDWAKAWLIAKKDLSNQRVSPKWLINSAQLCAWNGDFKQAEQLIDHAYTLDSEVNDGFARLGCIKKEMGDLAKTIEYFLRDQENKRLSEFRTAQYEHIKKLPEFSQENE